MSLSLELKDIIVTRQYDGIQYEICTHVSATGFLMYNFSTQYKPRLERFLKYHESLPYSSRIVRANSEEYTETMLKIQEQLKERARKEQANG
ncbi:hypothetical protein CC31p104 [Enterobacter phage CC31]|uniref:Uncharacterized protein n=1 Tax=Enterobacter phage CC31 TaxID=709484 RepID=E5DIB5_9CAUD|nr:hypothetical protein CC31p104 [Enterobacter phage CC31]ADB81600.1 conserved hypothetical protein [Enterobacter phage CC31]